MEGLWGLWEAFGGFWSECPSGDSGNWKNKNSAVCFCRNTRAETAEVGKTRIPLSVFVGMPGRRQRKLEKQEFRCLFWSEYPGGDSGNWKNKNPAVCFGRNSRAETAEIGKTRIPLSILVGIPGRRQRKLEKQESRCFLTEFLRKEKLFPRFQAVGRVRSWRANRATQAAARSSATPATA